MKTVFAMLPMALVLALIAGCSAGKAADRAKRMNDIKQIGLAFHEYLGANAGQAPAQPADLKRFIPDERTNTYLSSGDFVFIWGVEITKMSVNPGGAGGTVLGYEKDAPEKGGIVLFGDGVVKNLAAEEFNKLPKAKKP